MPGYSLAFLSEFSNILVSIIHNCDIINLSEMMEVLNYEKDIGCNSLFLLLFATLSFSEFYLNVGSLQIGSNNYMVYEFGPEFHDWAVDTWSYFDNLCDRPHNWTILLWCTVVGTESEHRRRNKHHLPRT